MIQPNPLEQAYAWYLATHVLNVEWNNFRLPGRLAVPFLSQSALPRELLRKIWAFCDPQTEGSLTTHDQFHVILRLVALAQNTPMMPDFSVWLQQTAHLQLPLANFQVTYPEPQALVQGYYNFLQSQQQVQSQVSMQNQVNMQQSSEPAGWDALDSLATVQDAPLPDLNALGSQAEPIDEFGGFADSTPSQEIGTEAFGEFSSTTQSQPVAENPAVSNNVETDGFGGFVESSVEPTSGWDALDALAEVTDAPLPALGSMDSVPTETPAVVEDDEFGDFSGPAEPVNTQNETINQQPEDPVGFNAEAAQAEPAPPVPDEPSGWDALDALAGTTAPIPAPALPSFDSNEAFGSFDGSAAPAPMPVVENNAQEDDDFGDFVGESTQASTMSAPVEDTIMGYPSLDIQNTGSQMSGDDFGDFVGNQSQEPTSAGTLETEAGSNRNIIEPSIPSKNSFVAEDAEPERQTSTNSWDAFDALAPDTDAPLPSLTSFGSQGNEDQTVQEDDFGDFEETPANQDIEDGQELDVGLHQIQSMNESVQSDQASGAPKALSSFASDQYSSDDKWAALDVVASTDSNLSALDKNNVLLESAPSDQQYSLQSSNDGRSVSFTDHSKTEMLARHNVSKEDAASAFRSSPDEKTGESFEQHNVPAQPMEHIDSAYFSAQTQSSVSDWNDFSDARQETLSNDDPFSAFDEIAETKSEDVAEIQSPDLAVPMSTQSNEGDNVGNMNAGHTAILTSEIEDNAFGGFETHGPPSGFGDLASVDQEVDQFGDFEEHNSEGQDTTRDENKNQLGMNLGGFGAKDDAISTDAYASAQSEGAFQSAGSPFETVGGGDEPNTASFGQSHDVSPADQDKFASQQSEADGGFGSFEGFHNDSTPSQDQAIFHDFGEVGTNVASIEDDAFGDFEGIQNQNSFSEQTFEMKSPGEGDASKVDISEHSDHFGNFEGFEPAAQTGEQLIDDQDFGDFGDFAEAEEAPRAPTPPPKEPSPAIRIRDKILELSRELPEPLLLQESGGHVDFNECFEANIGIESELTPQVEARLKRCVLLLMKLTSSKKKLGQSYWNQALHTILEEMDLGKRLVKEYASLSSEDRGRAREKMTIFLQGIGEFVRICRCIVATIADLLLLDSTALFTADTFTSSWCSLSLLKGVLDIEHTWKQLIAASRKLGLEVSDVESSQSIRGRTGDGICSFSLSPLAAEGENRGTLSRVEWEGMPFQAGCANFLIHKCTFYEVS